MNKNKFIIKLYKKKMKLQIEIILRKIMKMNPILLI